MPHFPACLRSMLRLSAKEAGRFRLDGVRVVSKDGVTTYEASDGRRIARATVKTPDAPPCDVVLPSPDLARLLGQPIAPDPYEVIDEDGDEVLLADPDYDELRGGVDFTLPDAPGGESIVSTPLKTSGPVRAGSTTWPDSEGPAIFPRGEPKASIMVNSAFVAEMVRAAADVSDAHGFPASVWLSIYEVDLPPDATHKKARRESRLVIQAGRCRDEAMTYASVLMPVAPNAPRPAMPYADAPATTVKD